MKRNRGKLEHKRIDIVPKKIKDTKRTFHTKIDTIKDRNCMDITEVEDTKKKWQEYKEELCKKDLHNPR